MNKRQIIKNQKNKNMRENPSYFIPPKKIPRLRQIYREAKIAHRSMMIEVRKSSNKKGIYLGVKKSVKKTNLSKYI